jgi:uncharacterized protein YbaR (Trm112 family)
MNELLCPHCGSRLSLDIAYDGENEKAEDFHPDTSKWWGYELRLECTCCALVYPIARMRSYDDVSKIRKEYTDA